MKRAHIRDNYRGYGLGVVVVGGAEGLGMKVLSVSHCLCQAGPTFVYQTFALSISLFP